MKHDIENKAVTQSPSNKTHSLIKGVQQEQKEADTKKVNWRVIVRSCKQIQRFQKRGRVKEMTT